MTRRAARRRAPRTRLPTGRVVVWGGFALVLAVAPLLFRSSLALTHADADGHRDHRLPLATTCCSARAAC